MTLTNEAELKLATQAALDGNWHAAHEIAQKFNDVYAYWLHAVLHKIEGDERNSRYWYAKSLGKHYEDFDDSVDELIAILNHLQH